MPTLVIEKLGYSQVVDSRCPTDEELIERLAAGDTSAFNTIFERYHRPVFSFINKQLKECETVEDLAQEVFLRVYKSAKTFDTSKKFSSWLFTIAYNEIKRYWKRSGGRQTLSLNAPVSGEDDDSEHAEFLEDQRIAPEAHVEQLLISRDLKAFIERLPKKQKTVVLLKVYCEMTFEEIAEICECPLSTVLSRMRYAVNKLRCWLGVVRDPTLDPLQSRGALRAASSQLCASAYCVPQ